MSFDPVQLLEVLRVFLFFLGVLAVIWGLWDLFGDSGQQSSTGTKKIIGGIAFAVISALLMTWAIHDIGQVAAISMIADLPIITR